ncbi:Bud site selection protein bud4 [Malassezia vespertilionis]|nr:Bud site selection protein bud4 [Malassezia vespertilionis]WFD04827.1 Bud site selection protein bud4 [Malassezia vespertilionis]
MSARSTVKRKVFTYPMREANSAALGLGIDVLGADDTQAERLSEPAPKLPSSATRDRVIIDDVLEQYSPPKDGDKVDWSYDHTDGIDASRTYDISRDSQVLPAIVNAYARLPTASSKNVKFDDHLTVQEAPARYDTSVSNEVVDMELDEIEQVTPTMAASVSPAIAAPPVTAMFGQDTSLPWETNIRESAEAFPLHAPMDSSNVASADRVENLVDQLLDDQVLSMSPASPAMKESVSIKKLYSPPTDAGPTLNANLPSLPSWSPITFDTTQEPKRAVELPAKTVRPHISRGTVRARVEERKQGILSETSPALQAQEALQAQAAAQEAVEAKHAKDRLKRRANRAKESHVDVDKDLPLPPPTAAPRSKRAQLSRLAPIATANGSETVRELASPLTQIQTNLQRTANQSQAAPPAAYTISTPEMKRQQTWFAEEASGRADVPQREVMSDRSNSPEYYSPLETEAEFQARCNSVREPTAFGNMMQRELTKIIDSNDQRYKVHNVGVFKSTADPDSTPTFQLSTEPPVWTRVTKPSDVDTFAAQKASGEDMTTGCVFFMIDSFIPQNLPIPKETVNFYSVLDNGIHMVKTGSAPLRPQRDGLCPILQEFELVEHARLELSVTLMLQESAHVEAGALDDTQRAGIGKLFNPFTPRHDGLLSRVRNMPLLHFANKHGTLGKASVPFDAVRAKCYARALVLDVPVRPVGDGKPEKSTDRSRGFAANLTKPRGTLRLRLFYLPPLPISLEPELPKSLEECVQGMDNIAWHRTGTSYKGTLTQLGGDCKSWRRRPVRIVGLDMMCYSEVTNRPTTRIDLMQALQVQSGASRSGDEDDALSQFPHAFCISFRDGENIYFYADTDAGLREWMRVLKNIVSHKLPAPPTWAQVAAADAAEFYGVPQREPRQKSEGVTSTVRTAVHTQPQRAPGPQPQRAPRASQSTRPQGVQHSAEDAKHSAEDAEQGTEIPQRTSHNVAPPRPPPAKPETFRSKARKFFSRDTEKARTLPGLRAFV